MMIIIIIISSSMLTSLDQWISGFGFPVATHRNSARRPFFTFWQNDDGDYQDDIMMITIWSSPNDKEWQFLSPSQNGENDHQESKLNRAIIFISISNQEWKLKIPQSCHLKVLPGLWVEPGSQECESPMFMMIIVIFVIGIIIIITVLVIIVIIIIIIFDGSPKQGDRRLKWCRSNRRCFSHLCSKSSGCTHRPKFIRIIFALLIFCSQWEM